MRKRIYISLLIYSASLLMTTANTLSFHPDSIYTIQMESYNLSDLGEKYAQGTNLADEIPTNEAQPKLNTKADGSHAQLWICESLSDSTFTLKNYKTGRYIWTNYQLPKSGKTWNEATTNKSWDVLAATSDINKLYMGPDAQTLGLKGINGFKAYAFDGEMPSGLMFIFPISNTNNALMNVSNSKPSTGWNIKNVYHKDNVPADSSSPSSTESASATESIKIIGNKVFATNACKVYNTTGLQIAHFEGEITLERGFYILHNSETSRKVFIP